MFFRVGYQDLEAPLGVVSDMLNFPSFETSRDVQDALLFKLIKGLVDPWSTWENLLQPSICRKIQSPVYMKV